MKNQDTKQNKSLYRISFILVAILAALLIVYVLIINWWQI